MRIEGRRVGIRREIMELGGRDRAVMAGLMGRGRMTGGVGDWAVVRVVVRMRRRKERSDVGVVRDGAIIVASQVWVDGV